LRSFASDPASAGESEGASAFRALPPAWEALMASTSWAFFMPAVPEMPMPRAIWRRSARSMELSPPPRFLAVVGSMVSVT
jgi:hypothetical protein